MNSRPAFRCVVPISCSLKNVAMLLVLPSLLQTIESKFQKAAKRMTKEEFETIMAKWVGMIKHWHFAAFGRMPKFSYDNNHSQGFASLARMGLTPQDVVPLATYSPDMHKVIEHAFGRLKPMLHKRLYEHGFPALNPLAAQELVKHTFLHGISKESIANDVGSLPQTYYAIALPQGVVGLGPDGQLHQGTGGDYPPRALR